MAGVSGTNFVATLNLTDVVGLGGDGATYLKKNGMSQLALYTLLSNIVTNFAALTAKLDADGGVTDEDYADNCDLTALASQGKGISDKGMYNEDLYNALVEIDANLDTLLAQLDADGGVEDEDYASTLAVTLGKCTKFGISQKVIIDFLDTFITNFNALNAKLDADESE